MNLGTDFPYLLTTSVIICGCIAITEWAFLSRIRPNNQARPVISDWSISFFPLLLLVLLIRSFLAQLYWVPTGSLEPSLKIGELTLVTQYDYGFHAPIWNTTLFPTGLPQRGDIAVFRWPVNEEANLIKRVIGVPGDVIDYYNNTLIINGKTATQTFIRQDISYDSRGNHWPMLVMSENLNGVKHDIYLCAQPDNCPVNTRVNFTHLIVPPHQYFMMGDNRDNSDDSRGWGFVNEANLVGKGRYVIFSWDMQTHHVRWNRIGTSL